MLLFCMVNNWSAAFAAGERMQLEEHQLVSLLVVQGAKAGNLFEREAAMKIL